MESQDKALDKIKVTKRKSKTVNNGSQVNGRRNDKDNASRYLSDHDDELGQFYSALLGYRNGDFTVRLPHTWQGTVGKIAEVMNEIMISSARRAGETVRISRVVGEEGKLRERFSS